MAFQYIITTHTFRFGKINFLYKHNGRLFMTSQANGVGHLKVDEHGLLNAKSPFGKGGRDDPKIYEKIDKSLLESSVPFPVKCSQTDRNKLPYHPGLVSFI